MTTDRETELVPSKTDAELAEEYKKRAVEVFGPVCELLSEASTNGFEVVIQAGAGAMKHQFIVATVQIKKVY